MPGSDTESHGEEHAARLLPTRPRRPVDVLLACYALVSAAALLGPHATGGRWPLLAVHLAGALLLLRPGVVGRAARRLASPAPRFWSAVHDWYPLLLVPVLYAELAYLNQAIHGGRYFDPVVIGWEQALFGGQPSRELASALPWRWVSEPLHGAYLSYYPIIYLPPLALFFRNRARAFRTVVLGLMLTFVAHYLFFIYFPVQGPRYLFPGPVEAGAQGPLHHLAHRILEAGSSRGAAFPSAHVGVAAAQALLCFRLLPRWAAYLAPLGAGLALGAVYGGFHYAVDALAGAALGLIMAAIALRLSPPGFPVRAAELLPSAARWTPG